MKRKILLILLGILIFILVILGQVFVAHWELTHDAERNPRTGELLNH